jgi:hypothetical protein
MLKYLRSKTKIKINFSLQKKHPDFYLIQLKKSKSNFLIWIFMKKFKFIYKDLTYLMLIFCLLKMMSKSHLNEYLQIIKKI